MTDRYPIRPISEDEFDAFRTVAEHAFHGESPSEQARADLRARFELDRSLAAFDGGSPVATAGAWSFQMCVPGAMAAVAGVTVVAVLPSHRRRGLLSALMHRQISDVHDREETLAVLWASEAGIYGRYGYGPASWHASFSIRHGEGALARNAPTDPGLRLRIAEPGSAWPDLAKVYETLLPAQPGMFARNEAWWRHVLYDPEQERRGWSPLRCVIAEDDAGPRGYALYAGRSNWDERTFLADSAIEVRELTATDPAASAVLWADLASRDLVSELAVRLRPADDPVLHLLADPRRARACVSDGLWVRVVDVPGALRQRCYACPVNVVIEITDELCPWNQGRWRLTAPGPDGDGMARCEQTSAAADVLLPVATLGAVYLGGTRLGPLARAGLAAAARPGALATLSAALSWEPAPWCPVIF